ncbi:MAG: DUF4388 domain-containing protein [Nitrospirota bacterium]
MSLEGSIKDFGLSDIFQLIYVQQKSGVMSIQDGSRRATVGFIKGMVVSAQMENAEGIERIGDVLVRAKRVSQHQLDKALKIQQETGDFLGQILVSQQAISESDLKKALRMQVLETAYRLFRWKDGRYSFDQRDVDYPTQYIDPISTEHILMEGIRRLDEWPPIEKKIPSLKVVFAQVPDKRGEIEQSSSPTAPPPAATHTAEEDPFADLESAEPEGRFSANEIAVYHAVNGSHDVARLIELLQIGEFEVCKALANLLSAGLIASVGVPTTSAAATAAGRGTPSEWSRHVVGALGWTLNLVVATAFVLIPCWTIWNALPGIRDAVRTEVRTLKTVLLANHLRALGNLVEVWRVEHGALPASVSEPIAKYGAANWPRNDPWGNPWSYDPQTGRVSVLDDNRL